MPVNLIIIIIAVFYVSFVSYLPGSSGRLMLSVSV